MNIKSICWLFLTTMSSTALLHAQGNSSNHDHNNCVPIIIDGERNPTPGETETYTHRFTAHAGEQFVWEVEGADFVDGNPTDQDHHGTLTKYGASIDVIWDDQSNTGRVSVTPLNPCAQIRKQDGGMVVNKAGCATPIISDVSDGADSPCAGETHEYTFNYPSLRTSASSFGCNEIEWVVKGISEVKITGWFAPINMSNCSLHYQNYEQTIQIADPSQEFVINEAYFGYITYSSSCSDKPNGIIGNEIEVTFANGVGEATIEARGTQCGTLGVGCGTRSAKRTLKIGVDAIKGLIGPSTVNCGSNGILYMVDGGDGGDITWTGINPDWTFDPVYYTVNIPGGGSVQVEYKDRFYLNTNNSGSGTIWLKSSNQCDEVVNYETINVGSSGLPAPPNLTGSLGTSFCDNHVVTFNVDDIGAGYEYQWELSNNGVITQAYQTTYNYLHITEPGEIDNIRVRHVAPCGYSDWEEMALDVTGMPTPFTDIEMTGSFCAGEQATFTAIDASSNHGDYEWNIYYDGNTDGGTTTNNSTSWLAPNDISGTGIRVEVSTDNGCHTEQFEKRFENNTNSFHIAPQLVMPDKYCGGFSNTFKVAEVTREKGAQYRWIFTSNVRNDNKEGYEMYEFTPNFGEVSQGNQYPFPGDITDFTITLEVRYNCADNWGQVASETVNPVVYNGCNTSGTSGGSLSIRLLPNPASDHLLVEFPSGGTPRTIRIVDAYGVERRNETTMAASHSMNIHELQMGVYTVIATEGTQVVTEHLQVVP